MRIFTRYILREVVSYALLGGVLFTFVLFMRDLGKITELVVRDSASFGDVLRLIAYTIPNTLTVSIPTAVLAGILLGLSRLAADSEVTAMRACGIGAFTFVRIVSILSFSALGLGLVNALYFAPRGARGLLELENSLKSSQVSFEVQPRVFYENFRNYVLYVQDVHPSAGAPVWNHVFLADITQPAYPHVTTADTAAASTESSDPQSLRLYMQHGGAHEISTTDPDQYNISTFDRSDLPIQSDSQDDTHISRLDTPLHALPIRELWQRVRTPGDTPDARAARIEFNIRFSYPFACLVLMLIGVPLGLTSKRGGKSAAFVLTLLLVFVYYFLSTVGTTFAKSGKLSPVLGVWGANLLFAAFGIVLLQQMAGGGWVLNFFTGLGTTLGRALIAITPKRLANVLAKLAGPSSSSAIDESASAPPRRARTARITLTQHLRRLTSFPQLLDEYVMRSYSSNFVLSLLAFILLLIVFSFFELIGDIVRNQTPFIIVGEYLINLVPYIVYTVTPLCSLLAVLITFGNLNRTSELTAMKATGISLYRVVTPVFVVAAIIGAALFAFDQSYLPEANRRQQELRAEIKHKPAQTFLNPDRQWISGPTDKSGAPARIFYYQAFQYLDPEHSAFDKLTVFEFDPHTFTLVRRIFASTVHWDPSVNRWIFDNGWQRTFNGETISSYQPFTVATFPEIAEQPSYFKKEDKPSDEMSYAELDRFIADLAQSGFDTIRYRVQLYGKIAYPVITLVMAVLAVPFALTMGKHGSRAGIAIAIGFAIGYWIVSGIFSSLGDVNKLPPLLAAWSPDLLFGIAGSYLLLRTPT
jgi:LPS export ABC transporter permease LptG/LPS export ABC transporter permease LptF